MRRVLGSGFAITNQYNIDWHIEQGPAAAQTRRQKIRKVGGRHVAEAVLQK